MSHLLPTGVPARSKTNPPPALSGAQRVVRWTGTTDGYYLQTPLRHLAEQHWESSVHISPFGWHKQARSPWQSPSSQSVRPSQSLSRSSAQFISLEGGVPQSSGQLHESSPISASQKPSPQGGEPQSTSQLNPSSLPSQAKSPQQEAVAGSSVQA